MRQKDWSQTALGPVENWPQSLKVVVRILLTSRYAMWMGWGNGLSFLYNDAYRPTLGVKHPRALGAPASEVWAEIWPEISPRIETVMHTGKATWDEGLLLFLERSGYSEETYHTFSYSPLADDDGVVFGMFCVFTEETERVIGERRLALLRNVAASLAPTQTQADVFTAIREALESDPRDLPFTLIYLFNNDSDTAELVCASGVPKASPIAVPVLPVSDSTSPWNPEAVLSATAAIPISNLPSLFDELPMGRWDIPPNEGLIVPLAQQGQERPAGFLVVGINPYRKLDQEYIGFIGLLAGQVSAALASARAYEDERRRAEALAELDLAKTTFFSNVSHEFRTPLTLMLGPVNELLERADEFREETRENLILIQRNGHRLLRLVNTLLDFSRIEAGRVQATYETVDLGAFTADLASVFRSAIEKAGLYLAVHCPSLPQPVYVNRDMWEKIVLNLVSNAFKFTFTGGIEVALTATPGAAQLKVRETGIGIPENELPQLFERFRRVEGARGRTHEGTGIGLALVQELVRLHGGTVAVESQMGQGTTFTVSIPFGTAHLPADKISSPDGAGRNLVGGRGAESWDVEVALFDGVTASPSIPPHPQPTPAPSAARHHILLADDNADMREFVKRLLQGQYDVEPFADAERALVSVRERRPSLVLSDVMMPGLDGFGLLRAIREDPQLSTLPVVLLSARAGEEARVEGLEVGADDYLTKPFSAKELLAVIKSQITLAEVRQEAENALREQQKEVEELNVRLQRAMRETHHRVKNNLQLTAAMVDMQAMEENRIPTREDFKHLGSQIRTLAAVHDLLTSRATEEGEVSVVSARAVLTRLLTMLQQGAQGSTLTYVLDDCQLPGRQANSLALLTNELVSNAMKHGRGAVEVRLTVTDNQAELSVRDNGDGFPLNFDPLTAAHTGLTIVESLTQMDLDGTIRYENHPESGGLVRVVFPLRAIVV